MLERSSGRHPPRRILRTALPSPFRLLLSSSSIQSCMSNESEHSVQAAPSLPVPPLREITTRHGVSYASEIEIESKR
jgi:hypothetical protein